MSSPAPKSHRCSGSNAFNLQIVVEAFFCTSPEGRKNYVKGRRLIWTVVVEKFSVDALTRQLAIELNIGSNQLVAISYFDKVLGEDVRLLHDEHYLMFDMYAAELKVPLSVVVVDVNGSSVFNGAAKIVDLVPINVVPADDPLVMATQNCANTIEPNDAQADHQTNATNCPTTPTQPAPPPIAESVTSEVKGKGKQSEGTKEKPAGKKGKKLQFVTPSTSDAVLKPTLGTKKNLLYWLGG